MTMIGTTYNVMPVPPDPDHTTWFDHGVLRVGVEYRVVDPEALAAAYEGDDLKEIEDHSPEGGFTDEGLSIHIESAADQHEYIRFDAFDDDPHYHYVDKNAGTNTLVGFDSAAHGPVVPWVLGQVRHRLPSMLGAAGAAHVADTIPAGLGDEIADHLVQYLPTIGIAVAPGEADPGEAS